MQLTCQHGRGSYSLYRHDGNLQLKDYTPPQTQDVHCGYRTSACVYRWCRICAAFQVALRSRTQGFLSFILDSDAEGKQQMYLLAWSCCCCRRRMKKTQRNTWINDASSFPLSLAEWGVTSWLLLCILHLRGRIMTVNCTGAFSYLTTLLNKMCYFNFTSFSFSESCIHIITELKTQTLTSAPLVLSSFLPFSSKLFLFCWRFRLLRSVIWI